MNSELRGRGDVWSALEVDATVADYFQMLMQELSGQQYSKSAHRRALLPRLSNRSEASVELKHQNVSAILIELGAPWIVGYKPRKNYQARLFDAVVARLRVDRELDEAARNAVEQLAVTPLVDNYRGLVVSPPKLPDQAEPQTVDYIPRQMGIKRDYLAIEARNRSLGAAGEQFVATFEHFRLWELGAQKLADKVEHVSETRGDGLGYDVLSFEPDGRERFIEVKTTAFGFEAPFYVTRTELGLSRAEPERFRLCRLYDFKRKPRMFELVGPLNSHCILDPANYLARFS
jgi:hypothetical protein